jgi:hypothetical protein
VFSILEQSASAEVIPIQQRKRTKLSGGIQEAASQHRRFVLIGEPGAGKTTTIRRLALEQAINRLNDPNNAPLPLLLYLPSWGADENIFQFIHRHWRLVTDPMGMLARGEIHLYLDGLNEMGAHSSRKVNELREWLRKDNSPKYISITCREGDYGGDLGLPIVVIETMNKHHIRTFASKYLGEYAPYFLLNVLPKNTVEDNQRHLFHLACNPFFLTALMIVYRNSPNGELPLNNGELMRALVKALWERERQKQTSG